MIIFTSSNKSYADPILDRIDPDHRLIHHRLYRENCIEYSEDFYIKDLRILDRDIKNIIIVDNAPYSFSYQIDNGYPIIPYLNDNKDNELKKLQNYLDELIDIEDIRKINKEKFKLQWLCTLNIEKFLKYYIIQEDNELSNKQLEENLIEALKKYKISCNNAKKCIRK